MASPADPEAWLDSHGDALYAYAMMRVRNTAVAEDLVQETLLAALGAMDGFDGRSSERTWLIGILKHKLIDYLRRSGREQTVDASDADAAFWDTRFDHTGHWLEPPRDWGDPARLAEDAGLAAALATCIEELPERQRALFVLREIDGLDTGELLDALGISSANNLWVMLSRARTALRECIERCWFAGTRA